MSIVSNSPGGPAFGGLPTTVLRTVPLPRADAQGRKGADAFPPPWCVSETGEGDHPKGGGGGAPQGGLAVTIVREILRTVLIIL